MTAHCLPTPCDDRRSWALGLLMRLLMRLVVALVVGLLLLPGLTHAQSRTQVRAGAALPAWTPPPADTVALALGAAGDAAVVDGQGTLRRRDASAGSWPVRGSGMERVAIDGRGQLWAITRRGTLQWLDGSTWRDAALGAGHRAVDVAPLTVASAAAAGGVVVALADGRIGRYDPATRAWRLQAGAATRVAADAQGSLWIVGADGVVQRSLGEDWHAVNGLARDIAADADGRVVIVGLDQRLYRWREASARWEPLPIDGAVRAVALGGGQLWRLDLQGQVLPEGMAAAGVGEAGGPGVAGPSAASALTAPRPQVQRAWVAQLGAAAQVVQVAVTTQGDVHALDRSGALWRLAAADAKAGSAQAWSRQVARFAAVRATLDGNLWGVEAAGVLWLRTGSLWRSVAEGVRDVFTTPEGQAWTVLTDGRLQALGATGPPSQATAAPSAAAGWLPPAAARVVAAVADEHGQPWLRLDDGRIERFDGQQWRVAAPAAEGLSGVAIGLDGSTFALGPQGALRRLDAASGRWVAHDGPLRGGSTGGTPASRAAGVHLAVAPDGTPWVVTADGELHAERPVSAQDAGASTPPAVFTRLLNWQPLGGGPTTQITVGPDGSVYGLGADGSAWRWKHPATWTRLPGRFVQLVAGEKGRAWGLDAQGRARQLQGGLWLELPGEVRLLARGPGATLWAVQGADTLLQWQAAARQWQPLGRVLPGSRALAAGPTGQPWLIDERGGVQTLRQNAWVPLPGLVATSLDVGPEGTVYATSSDQRIWWLDERDQRWKPATGLALQVAVGPAGAPLAVGPRGDVLASSRFLADAQARDAGTRLGSTSGVADAGRSDATSASSIATAGAAPTLVITPGVAPTQNKPLVFQTVAGETRLQDIGIGADGTVLAVGSDGSLQCFSNPDQRFVLASPGRNQRVAVQAGGQPWLVANNGVVSRFEGRNGWRTVPEFLGRDVAVGPDGQVWAVGVDGDAYRYGAASARFERQAVTQSDGPVKATRVAGALRGVHWLVTESHQLMRCEAGVCNTRLIGATDVATAPDNTVFALDLLGSVQRWNEARKTFERQNGSGVSIAVGPQGLPWLVDAQGRVRQSGLMAVGSRSVNTAQCALAFAQAPTPEPATVSTLRAVDDAATLEPGASLDLLANDRFNGRVPTPADVTLQLLQADPGLTLAGGQLQLAASASAGSTRSASYQLCSRSGVPTCAAARVSVRVIAPAPAVPGPVQAVSAVAGDGQVLLNFTAPGTGGGGITGYQVTVNPGGATVLATGSPVVIGGLVNGTAYRFTVRALNAAGAGPDSAATPAVVPATVPGAPTAVAATAGNGQATVSFAAPASSGGSAITGYTVTASPGGATASGAASPIVVPGLSNGTTYTFTVRAISAVGAGALSVPSAAVTPSAPATVPGAPTAVQATAGNAQATVSFTAPLSNGGSTITGYRVTASPGGATASGTASPITVGGLLNGQAYVFTVEALNAVGAGPASVGSAAVVPVTVPGVPTAVAATAGNGQVTVSFTAPASSGGSAITGYTVTASPGGATASGAASPIVVPGLSNGTAYTFTVRAISAVGAGALSVPSAAVTPSAPATVPGAPTAVQATAGNAQATVSFTAPLSNGGSAITGYRVTASPGGATASGTASPITVGGLLNGQAYVFTVEALNAVGAGPASVGSAAVVPATVPGAPTAVAATAGNGQATVSFAAPASSGGSAITGYTVTASPGGATASGAASPIVVRGLSNGTAYTFTVRAISAVGAGALSVPSAAVTPSAPATVPGAPTAVQATAGNAQATVSFTAPLSNGGSAITGYRVTASPGGATASGTASPITVGGLLNGQAYVFTVEALNAVGAGPASVGSAMVVPATVPGAPTAVAATAGNGQATVSFAAPASSGGSAITGYTVTASPGGATASGAASPIVVPGLSNGTAYTFTVRAISAVGAGALSVPSAAVTPSAPATVPGAPTAVQATAGNAQATVSFTAPLSNGGSTITGYRVTASPGGATASGTASPITVGGLLNGQAYVFTVEALNAVGAGPASVGSAMVVPVALPGAPTAVVAEAGTGAATVRFDAPITTGGLPITRYAVTASPGGATVVGEASPLRVAGLANGTAYTFTVRASNALGQGPVSLPSAAVTPATTPDAPTEVVAEPGSGQALVRFVAPVDNGGRALTSYRVTASPGGQTATGMASPVLVTGLTNGQPVRFTVVALNALGAGVPSLASAPVTPVGLPGAPSGVTALAAPGQATVRFVAPADSGGTPVTGYRVTAHPGGATVTVAASPAVVTGLLNGQPVTFSVEALNAMGAGPAASSAAAVTPAAPPGAPLAVLASAGEGQAQLRFDPPMDTGGAPVIEYRITVSPGGRTLSAAASPLLVTGLTNGVSYSFTVAAVNVAGAGPLSASSAPVVPATRPGVPTAVVATRGDGQALVAFSAPASNGGRPITQYSVTASPGGATATGAASPLRVTGLANGTAYTFTVRATNAVGTGDASAPSAAVVPATVPAAPTAVTEELFTTSAVWIGFTQSASDGGLPITGYRVEANPPDPALSIVTGSDWRGNPRFVVTGLTFTRAYTFRVVATNAAGDSAPSAPSAVVNPSTRPLFPGAISGVPGNGQITVNLLTPASDGGSPITSYTVEIWPLTPNGEPRRFVSAPGPSVLVTGLTNGVEYAFHGWASNAQGRGATSPANGATPGPAPGAPTAVSAVRGNAQATVSFTPPAGALANPITGYTVTASPGGATASGGGSPIVVPGLSNGTAYTFTVRAANAVGLGSVSAPSAPVTPATVPAAPTGVTEELFTTSAVWIGFTPSASDGGLPITGYRVEANPPDPALSIVTGSDWRGNPRFVVTGLTFTRAYTFSVVATNAAGDSAPSAPSAVVNPSTRPLFPGAISGVPGNGQITVNLLTPASDGGSPITSYTVEIWPLTPNGEPRRFVSAPGPSVLVTGLTNGVAYCYHGWASNANGQGATSPACPAGGTTPGP